MPAVYGFHGNEIHLLQINFHHILADSIKCINIELMNDTSLFQQTSKNNACYLRILGKVKHKRLNK